MISLILFVTIVINLVSCYVDVWNLVHFSKNRFEIRECLENTEGWGVIREYVEIDEWREWLLRDFSRNLKTKTVRVEYINETASQVVHILRRENVLNNDQMPLVRVALVGAIMNCSDAEEDFDEQLLGYHNPPRFIHEIPEAADLLNFILVNARYLYEYSVDLRTLDNYFRQALLLIERALHIMRNSSHLINELNVMWWRRSGLFYDHNSIPDYIRHVFSYDRLRPYTRDDPNLFLSRRFVPLIIRNPLIENNERVFEIRQFNAINWRDHNRNFIYSLPPVVLFTRSLFYFKNLKSIFFRFLFLYLDLIEIGIVNSDNTNNSSPVPRHLVPEDVRQILYNDTVYDDYLLNRQNVELNTAYASASSIHTSYNEVLERGHRIAEPDLLLMYYYRVVSRIQTSTNTTISASNTSNLSDRLDDSYEFVMLESFMSNNTINTTAASTEPSSTSRYEESKETDGQEFQDLSGKDLLKKKRGFSERDDVSDVKNQRPNCVKECEHSEELISYIYYGYILGSGNRKYLRLKELQSRLLLSLLKSQTYI